MQTEYDKFHSNIEAGASLNATDKAYNGTPLEWAIHMQTEEGNEAKKEDYAAIENYFQHLK